MNVQLVRGSGKGSAKRVGSGASRERGRPRLRTRSGRDSKTFGTAWGVDPSYFFESLEFGPWGGQDIQGPDRGRPELGDRMNCLNCKEPLPKSYFQEAPPEIEARQGPFSCPHCYAEHVRRRVGELPSGKPLHTLRLWGPVTSVWRKR